MQNALPIRSEQVEGPRRFPGERTGMRRGETAWRTGNAGGVASDVPHSVGVRDWR
jgi:hypothetical protein